MYQPDHFRVDDVSQMHALMRGRPFAALVSAGPAGLYASHLPTVLKDEGPHGLIECHLARANPHCQELACKELGAVGEALMIFQGADGYITPNWYPSKAQNGKVVPTWNYAVVHAYGRPEVMNDAQWLLRHVTELTAQQETSAAKSSDMKPSDMRPSDMRPSDMRPWAVSDAPASYINAMLRGIVGFRFAITRLEGKWKMSQNREPQDRDGVVAGLGRRGGSDDAEMAALVARPPTARGE